MAGFRDRVRQAVNILTDRDPFPEYRVDVIPSYDVAYARAWRDNQSTVMAPIKTRIAIDVANVPIRHVQLDEYGNYKHTIDSELNERLNIDANIDQTGRAYIQDAAMTMLEEGVAALLPTETSNNPAVTSSYDIYSLRVGVVLQWYSRHVKLWVYRESEGARVEKIFPKSFVALPPNPLYYIMNEPNSTLRRLVDKLALLDVADNKINSPNLDMVVQVPYTIRSDKRRLEAQKRIQNLQEQLNNSAYGMAYLDASEKITQLNRPVTNALADQVQYLQQQLHNQLGLSEAIFAGTASQEEYLGYYNRTVSPILHALTEAMRNTFLTRNAINKGEAIRAFPNLFQMAPLETIAEAADKFTRNEIMTGNEIRQAIGIHPHPDPSANELRNKNLNKEAGDSPPTDTPTVDEED
jgi:hypothetical protein